MLQCKKTWHAIIYRSALYACLHNSTLLAAAQDEDGAAGLTTVSNASFFGTTRFIGNEWGALQTK
jgi:hypothetical protein